MNSATFDSNIYISALQFGGLGARLLGMARVGMFRLDVSEAILDETIGVLRDKFAWEPYSLLNARQTIRRIANVVVPAVAVNSSERDPDDNRILECAFAAASECIVTEDQDLLRLKEFEGIRIIRSGEFFDQTPYR